MNNKKLKNILLNIYREMYENSTPSADFDEIDKTVEGFFLDYEIDSKLAQEIVDKHTKKLRKYDKSKINHNVWLGCSPKFTKND